MNKNMNKKIIALSLCSIFILTGCTKYQLVKVEDTPNVQTTEQSLESTTETMIDEETQTSTETIEEKHVVVDENSNNNIEETIEPTQYVCKSKLAFTCSEPLETIYDDEYYSSFSWKRDSGQFDVNISKLDNTSLQDEIEIIKDVYSEEDGTILKDEETKSNGGYDSYIRVIEYDDYYTSIIATNLNGTIVEIKCNFSDEDGYNLANEASESFTYLGIINK